MEATVYRTPRRPKPPRATVLARDGNTCVHCGEKHPAHKLTIDHIVPIGLNVDNEQWYYELSNLQTLCKNCHAKKNMVDGPLVAAFIAKFERRVLRKKGIIVPTKTAAKSAYSEGGRKSLKLNILKQEADAMAMRIRSRNEDETAYLNVCKRIGPNGEYPFKPTHIKPKHFLRMYDFKSPSHKDGYLILFTTRPNEDMVVTGYVRQFMVGPEASLQVPLFLNEKVVLGFWSETPAIPTP